MSKIRGSYFMKRKIIISLLLSVVFALTGCTAEPTKLQPTSVPTSTPVITVQPTKPSTSELSVHFVDAGQTNETEKADTSKVDTETSYIGNVKTKKFHRSSCHTLPAEKNRAILSSRDEAINAGYSPCRNCHP